MQQRMWLKSTIYILVIGLVVLNGVAFLQAHALTHFAPAGQPTAQPESLSWREKVQTIVTGVTIPKPLNTHSPLDLGLPFETHRIAVPGNGTLEAWFIPSHPSHGIVTMFHSYAASKESLLLPANVFHDLGYSTLLVDFRGAGGSSGYETTLGVREASDVGAAVGYVQQHWPEQPFVLYGVSMGSTAIMRAVAHDLVQPRAVILESPFDRLTQTTRHRFAAIGLPAFPTTELLLFWGSVQQGFNAFTHNPIEYAPNITCPTLLLYGARDLRVTEGETQAIFAQLGGPKTLARIPNAGHELLQLAAPEPWTEHVTRFLAHEGVQ